MSLIKTHRWSLLSLVLLAACGQTAGRAPAGIQGVTSMVKVGELVFIPSLLNSDVRVLDLSAPTRDFVRAPNPLEALSIPVIQSPQAVATDIAYADIGGLVGGQEVAGPYVYAWSPGSPEVSVIGAARSSLIELARLEASAPITALAARGSLDGGSSTLYIGTVETSVDGGTESGFLKQLTLPPPAQLAGANLNFETSLAVTDIGAGSPAGALAPGIIDVILPLPGDGEQLLVSTRDVANTNNNSPPADTVWFQRAAPTVVSHLGFTNQVRRMQIQAATAENTGVTPALPAGYRIFGLLDEQACNNAFDCEGLQAVDRMDTGPSSPPTFPLAQDASGRTMLTLRPIQGRPTSFLTAPDAGITVPVPNSSVNIFDLGFIASGTNSILVFNAGQLRPIDVDSSGPTADSTGFDAGDFVHASAAEGTARNDTVHLTYSGLIATVALGPFVPDGGGPFPVGSLQPLLLPNDEVVFQDAGTDCTVTLPILKADGGTDQDLIIPDMSQTPPGCQDRQGFSLKAGIQSPKPFVLVGDNFGFLGRMAVNTTFTDPQDPNSFLSRYYFHPGFAGDGGFTPQASLSVTLGPTLPPIQEGTSYTLTVNSHFTYYTLKVPSLGVPSTMVHDSALSLLEISYPGVDGVAEGNLVSPDVTQMFPAVGPTYQ